jgi:hypothetical protein
MRIYPQVINHGNWKSPFSTQVFTKKTSRNGGLSMAMATISKHHLGGRFTNPANFFSKKTEKSPATLGMGWGWLWGM